MELERSRLFEVAPSHIYLSCHYDWRTGWGLKVTTPGQEPGTTSTREYDGLTHPELIDVVDSELERVLGLRDSGR